VCEGYSKAFKYLCDNSSWSSSVNCYLVTGKLSSEDHMWNIVTIGSDAYLVDVTNSDGLPSGSTPLFLRGGTRSGDSYTFSRGGSDNLTFTYDSDTTSLWSSSILTLAASDYEAPAELEIKHSLTLGDDIGVNFYVKNWTDANAYMTFTVNGKNTIDNGSDYEGMQKFTCTVNSLEMGMDISAVYHYSGGTKSETYSVSQYINEALDDPSKLNNDANAIALVKATADYGHYVQQYLFELHPGISGNYTAMSNKNNLDSSDISTAKSGLSSSNYDLIRNTGQSGIENVTFSLYLDAKTSIYLYLNPAKDYTGTPTVSAYSVENVGGRYRIVVPNLGAAQLSDISSVTVTANSNFTISNISAYAYAKLILNSDTTSEKAKYAMAALYNYCQAAKAYKGV
ncbi:MAG: hypothetical protein IK990_04165, partial [Ruminiclostridium sp.]|nr:hypothetical protein [Ruminiclostridium sp.]